MAEFATLTSSLLARKGQASPAAGVTPYDGIEFDGSGRVHFDRQRHPLPLFETGGASDTMSPRVVPFNARNRRPAQTQDVAIPADDWRYSGAQPLKTPGDRDNNQITDEKTQPKEDSLLAGVSSDEQDNANCDVAESHHAPVRPDLPKQATVTFKMPAREFVRLHVGAKTLGISRRSIIQDAIECYLDANGIPPISDARFQTEISRLAKYVAARHRDRNLEK